MSKLIQVYIVNPENNGISLDVMTQAEAMKRQEYDKNLCLSWVEAEHCIEIKRLKEELDEIKNNKLNEIKLLLDEVSDDVRYYLKTIAVLLIIWLIVFLLMQIF